MRIAMIAVNDPAGTAILMCRALNRHTAHQCRLITTELRYNFMFPKDLHLPWLDGRGMQELEQVLRQADVFHFHLVCDESIQLGPFTPAQFMRGKAIVHHHHGHPDFRGDPLFFQDKYRRLGRKNLLVSTPDLLPKLPGAVWQPNFVPQDMACYAPDPRQDDQRVILAHSPTRKDLKNTDDLLAIYERLAPDFPELALDIIENTPHAECLLRKQRCDIFFDHMQGYYGMASLEALAQGRPVIAGLDGFNIGNIREFFACASLPWIIARDNNALETTLRDLLRDPEAREQAGREARSFMERVWTEKRVINALASFYDTLQ